jgi:branched-chain amino acid aminotransferase
LIPARTLPAVNRTAVWVDGEVRETPAVSPLDHGFLVGDGVFETLKTVDGQPFALTRHLRRLERSAAGLHLVLPPEPVVRGAVADVLAVSAAPTGRLRITVTSGAGPLGSARGEDPPTLVVTHATTTRWPPSTRLVTVSWARNERGATAGLKTTSYADNVVALRAAREQGADEAVFTDTRGRICEGTGTNIFYVLNGHLTTPSLATGCLAGITRELVIEVADVMVADAPVGMLTDVDEAFVTSSTREVQPVSHIDGRQLPACPGPHTTAAMAAFSALVTRTFDP